MSLGMFSLKGAVFVLLLLIGWVSCASLVSRRHDCDRAYSDSEIRNILGRLGLVPAAYKANINWLECKYYIAIWELPVTPDTQTIVVLDSRGKLIEGSR
jgi:hypothetical protein